MKDPLDFTGKVALVTGSSRGIGAEMIRGFGTRGAQCVVNYVADAQGQNKADALGVAKELNEPLVIECDVTQPQQVEAMMKQIQDQRGGLDILVNNSGVISDRTIKKMSLDEFESVIRVNLIGTFTVTQKAAAILRNGGRVINMSSVSGQMGLFGQANYSSSKAGNYCAHQSFSTRVCAAEHNGERHCAWIHRCRNEQRHAGGSDAELH